MKKTMINICIFVLSIILYANEKKVLSKESVNEHWKDISFWEHGISSKLIEQGHNHSWESIKDNDLSTAWVEGKDGDGIEEWVIIPVKGAYQYLDYEDGLINKKLKILLRINNGFCKNESTYLNNNRIKKAKITIYEVPLIAYEDSRGTQALDEPSIMNETEITLKDIPNQQEFLFNCFSKSKYVKGNLYLYIQLTILDVYPGEKYHDTCISEMSATAKVIDEIKKNVKRFFSK